MIKDDKAKKPSGESSCASDAEDLERARNSPEGATGPRPWYKWLGPGLITGAADDDPSGVGTYSADGAQYGYGLLWLIPLSLPLMIAIQEMCGRIATVTGCGLAAVIKEHYPKWLLFSSVALLVGANVFNIYADINVMAATGKLLFGLPVWAGVVGLSLFLVASQILVPYRSYARWLKYLCIGLAGYAVVAFMPGAHNNWVQIGKSMFIPQLKINADSALAVVAFLGTTISPYLFFWQAGETVEEKIAQGDANEPGDQSRPVPPVAFRRVRADTTLGMMVSQAVAFFILIAAAGTLHATGKTDINSADEAARALSPLGPSAVWIFSLCIIGTGLLAVPTLAGSVAYSVAEVFGWRYGLYRRFSRARRFYLTLALVIVVGSVFNFVGVISPVKALVYSAALNGIVAPPLIVVLLLICNNKRIVKGRTNRVWSNVFGWLTVAVMGPAAIYLIYATFAGKA